MPSSPLSDTRTSRRLALAAPAGAGAIALATPGRAEAAKPARYRGAPLLSAADHHLATRFSYGVTPALTQQVRKAGGASKWFAAQLKPATIADGAADALVEWWPSLRYSPQKLWLRQITDVEGGWEVMANYQRWLLMRRITSRRQVSEVMTEFWMNHLNVAVHHDATFTYRFSYDAAVRRYALGRFSDLLVAAITHPAMSMYLDNAVSTRKHPNENLGRELLELHTVGRGNFTEDDVKNSARILTGYVVDMWDTWDAAYSPADHWTGRVEVMGFSHPNGQADGRAVTEAYLRYLAGHRRTAERIARKLCVKFVGDTPSAGLVDRLAQVYLDHDTDIAAVLRALVASPEFKRSAGQKVRDPSEDLVATYRALGVQVRRPTTSGAAANAMLWQADSIGATPCDWPRPDGAPIDNASWSSPARLLASMNVHWSMSGGWWPTEGAVYRTPRQWLPSRKVRFAVLVDHLCQQLLGRRSTGVLLQACLDACQDEWKVRAGTVITAEHALVKWGMNRVLATLLDSPQHLTR